MENKNNRPLWYVILTVVLIIAGAYFSYMYLGAMIDAVIMTLSEGTYPIGPFAILSSVLWLVIYRYCKKNRKIFKGFFDFKNTKKALILSLPILAYAIISNYKSFLNPQITLTVICTALYAGICEDVTWRALPITHIMKFDEVDEKKLLLAAYLPAIGFACSHFSNISAGSAVSYVLLQVFQTFGVGLLFGAIYLRTGDMTMLFIVHVLNDLFSFMGQQEGSVGIHEGVSFDASLIFDIVASILMIAYGVYLIRKSKRPDIIELWKDKWSKDTMEECAE